LFRGRNGQYLIECFSIHVAAKLWCVFLIQDRRVDSRVLRVALTCLDSATKGANRRTVSLASRTFSSDGGKKELPFGLSKIFGVAETDNLIATDRDRKIHKGNIPDFIPDDIKKDLDKLGIDNIEELDELEAANTEGYNDLGLVPPEGTGTFASPILVPSRRATRQVGFVDPESHEVFWFTIHNDDNSYYIKDLGLFFKMLHIPDEEAFAGAH
jgi:hypothetical protein